MPSLCSSMFKLTFNSLALYETISLLPTVAPLLQAHRYTDQMIKHVENSLTQMSLHHRAFTELWDLTVIWTNIWIWSLHRILHSWEKHSWWSFHMQSTSWSTILSPNLRMTLSFFMFNKPSLWEGVYYSDISSKYSLTIEPSLCPWDFFSYSFVHARQALYHESPASVQAAQDENLDKVTGDLISPNWTTYIILGFLSLVSSRYNWHHESLALVWNDSLWGQTTGSPDHCSCHLIPTLGILTLTMGSISPAFLSLVTF